MCFKLKFFKRLVVKDYPCSCEICGASFGNTEDLIKHMGYHTTEDINKCLRVGYGTVRCSTCWRSFRTVATMDEHTCPPIIRDDSLDSIVIHE